MQRKYSELGLLTLMYLCRAKEGIRLDTCPVRNDLVIHTLRVRNHGACPPLFKVQNGARRARRDVNYRGDRLRGEAGEVNEDVMRMMEIASSWAR